MDKAEKIMTRIRLFRESIGVNQTTFANEIGIPRTTLINYEKGVSIPVDLLLKLKKKYGLNIDWLLTGEGEMFLPGKDPRKPQEKRNVADLAKPQEAESDKSETVSDLGAAHPDSGKSATVADLAKSQAAGSGIDTMSYLDTAPQMAPVSELPAGLDPPKRIRRISMDLQGLADELDAGGPVPARLRPLVRRVARLDDEDLAKTTAYVDDLLQKVKYAQGDELDEADTSQGGAATAGIA